MDVNEARLLTSDEGARLLAEARETRGLPPHRRVEHLRKLTGAGGAHAALAQDDLRQRARARCPHAERLLFTREALEQATAWPVAAERALRWPGPADTPLFDLGAGIGLDALAAAEAGRPVRAVERDPVRAILLAANARALGLDDRVEVVQADLSAAPLTGSLAYLDPGRRPAGRRTREPEEFEPPRSQWPSILEGFGAGLVKLPPHPGSCPGGERPFEVVSLDGRARERRLFWRGFENAPPRRALSLPSGHAISGHGVAWPAARAPREGDWLLDPDPSVTLADLVGDLAEAHALAPVHPRIAWLVGDRRPEAAPGRVLRIEAVLRARPRELNAWLRAHGIGRLDVKTRGVAEDAAAWRSRLKIPGGEAAAVLAITRTPADRWIALASLPGEPATS